MEIIQNVLGLIAYPATLRPQLKAFRHMTGDCRWSELATQFEKESFQLYGLQEHSMFTHALQTGISVLKTVFCDKTQLESQAGFSIATQETSQN